MLTARVMRSHSSRVLQLKALLETLDLLLHEFPLLLNAHVLSPLGDVLSLQQRAPPCIHQCTAGGTSHFFGDFFHHELLLMQHGSLLLGRQVFHLRLRGLVLVPQGDPFGEEMQRGMRRRTCCTAQSRSSSFFRKSSIFSSASSRASSSLNRKSLLPQERQKSDYCSTNFISSFITSASSP